MLWQKANKKKIILKIEKKFNYCLILLLLIIKKFFPIYHSC